jgi:hypothetical protein
MNWLTVTEYLCHIWPRICSSCHSHNTTSLSSFMIHHRIFNKSNSVDTTSGAGIGHSCGSHEFI